MEECIGKKLYEEKVKELTNSDAKFDEATTKVSADLVKKLEEALCCVTYPVIEKYFSWKHMWFKSRIVHRKFAFEIINILSYGKYVNVLTEIVAHQFGDFISYKKLEFTILGRHNRNGDIVTLIKYDGDERTPDEVINIVIKVIAQYTVKFNKENHVESNR